MELFKQIIELLRVIIWPIVVLLFGIFFRNSINRLLLKIKGAKYKEFEVEFQQNIDEAQNHMKQISVKINDKINGVDLDKIKKLSEISPRSLITESWLELENEIYEKYKKAKIRIATNGINLQEDILLKNKIINENEINAYKNLRNIRNKASHSYDFTIDKDQSIEYALTVNKLLNSIKSNA